MTYCNIGRVVDCDHAGAGHEVHSVRHAEASRLRRRQRSAKAPVVTCAIDRSPFFTRVTFRADREDDA